MIKHFQSDWMTNVDFIFNLIDVMSQSSLSIIIILASLFVLLASFITPITSACVLHILIL
jgi:hypothetical protein